MKKLVILIPILILLVGCTNKVEENKIAYLEYKKELEKTELFNKEEEIHFNTYFNIEREDEEVVNYSIIINEPTIDMYSIKALLIHDYYQEETFPSVGIFGDEVKLQKESGDKIILSGTIQTLEDISDVNFKLYLEYQDENGEENKIYYEVARG